ncbi:hypothetical protein [Rhodococcus sp. NPDC058521]|uniref:hypothetical protein n=1 Tax=Rhodococcus sp. NPDC058521 TaxID=3346536 RepID=UPI0036460A54
MSNPLAEAELESNDGSVSEVPCVAASMEAPGFRRGSGKVNDSEADPSEPFEVPFAELPVALSLLGVVPVNPLVVPLVEMPLSIVCRRSWYRKQPASLLGGPESYQ